MSETMSDWPQYYDQTLSDPEISNRFRVLTSESLFGDPASDTSAVVNTSTVTTGSATVSSGLGDGPSGGHLSPEGRVGKPVRRRSRASRRTPTTLLNTDTTNFRAMVQQFTGAPTAPFAAGGSHSGGPNFGVGFQVNPNNSLMLPPTGFHLQYQQNQSLHHPQNQPLMFSLNRNDNNPGTGEVYFQRLGGGNPRATMEGGGAVAEGVSSQVPGSRTSNSSNENRTNPRHMF
ncbi:VQ motif-containing protein 22-like [Hibiscus syriacus]|uniref:VQ motif-containing protein 22-like n=1 Tax=Hibiscus syriacus TaxID=106335 RepID=UPI001921581B|nr:VQ motif-containing protein 22-like [Hibiscus syriacus]